MGLLSHSSAAGLGPHTVHCRRNFAWLVGWGLVLQESLYNCVSEFFQTGPKLSILLCALRQLQLQVDMGHTAATIQLDSDSSQIQSPDCSFRGRYTSVTNWKPNALSAWISAFCFIFSMSSSSFTHSGFFCTKGS